jgi:Leucine-rich repeat (LRR) protein
MRDLAFYILENDGGTPPAKHLYLYRPGENLEKFPREWEAISTARRVSLQCNKLKHLPGRFCAPDLLTLLLRANSCENSMISIPASFLSNFPKLKVLDLTCGQFDTLPEELADLKNLVYLNLSNCKNLKILPAAVTHLHMLQNLDLSFCRNLEYLPSGLPNLTSLQVLNTDWCLWLRWGEPTPSRMARAEELGQIYPTITTALEDICKLFTLTHLTIAGNISPMVKFPHNICALTQLRVLEFNFDLIEILPADMAYHFIHLQKLVIDSEQLEYLPRSFTCCDAFPALIVLQILCPLEEFPEVDEGALPQLRILCIWCPSLKMLPLSLEVLSNLRKLKLIDCEEKLKNCCRKNSKKSAVWREYFKIDFIDSEY